MILEAQMDLLILKEYPGFHKLIIIIICNYNNMLYYFVIFLSILLFLFLNLFLFFILILILIIIIIFIYFILFQKKCYNNITIQNLEKYGNYKIKNVYLIKKNVNIFIIIMNILNMISLYQYNDIINDLKEKKPYHLKLLIEIQNNKKTKFLIIEKITEILLHDKINFDKNSIMTKIPIIKNKYTIHNILNKVQEKMKNNYFNWDLITNNCQKFITEIIYFIHKKKKIYRFQKNKFDKYKNFYFIYIINFFIILMADLFIFIKTHFYINILSLFV